MGFGARYLELESRILDRLSQTRYIQEVIHDTISGRITLFLMVVGTIAFFNELYITIEMSFLQKETYEELNKGYIDESLKLHKMIVSDEYHGREYMDEKSGIVIEEFEEREKFFAKPVHVAHLYVVCNILKDENPILSTPLQFHIEFSPEEYEGEKRLEFGCRLKVLRTKLYHLFKDSPLYDDLVENGSNFTVSKNVRIYNTLDELLPTTIDAVQLCFLKMETGDKIKCNFVIDN
ncbi:hypothetical protein HG535_0D00870 [Zygotorulaspora mrakii]|uniref:Uncharacterized protein n=1 Tax=Zygotorulaspora mrakii TaxID=42260 RepID=A0A7H9B339_ZYGMR|nr:uncharacterized protein HG535_0D00870 [Zygotorulaspora mrakii]QLG72379.1 hypothetical protein HG535_0D00870 [Zygotorulaspora mrakii]